MPTLLTFGARKGGHASLCPRVLVSEGVVRRVNEHGHTGELDWLASRIDAEYFVRIRDAIIAAADELKALDAPAD